MATQREELERLARERLRREAAERKAIEAEAQRRVDAARANTGGGGENLGQKRTQRAPAKTPPGTKDAPQSTLRDRAGKTLRTAGEKAAAATKTGGQTLRQGAGNLARGTVDFARRNAGRVARGVGAIAAPVMAADAVNSGVQEIRREVSDQEAGNVDLPGIGPVTAPGTSDASITQRLGAGYLDTDFTNLALRGINALTPRGIPDSVLAAQAETPLTDEYLERLDASNQTLARGTRAAGVPLGERSPVVQELMALRSDLGNAGVNANTPTEALRRNVRESLQSRGAGSQNLTNTALNIPGMNPGVVQEIGLREDRGMAPLLVTDEAGNVSADNTRLDGNDMNRADILAKSSGGTTPESLQLYYGTMEDGSIGFSDMPQEGFQAYTPGDVRFRSAGDRRAREQLLGETPQFGEEALRFTRDSNRRMLEATANVAPDRLGAAREFARESQVELGDAMRRSGAGLLAGNAAPDLRAEQPQLITPEDIFSAPTPEGRQAAMLRYEQQQRSLAAEELRMREAEIPAMIDPGGHLERSLSGNPEMRRVYGQLADAARDTLREEVYTEFGLDAQGSARLDLNAGFQQPDARAAQQGRQQFDNILNAAAFGDPARGARLQAIAQRSGLYEVLPQLNEQQRANVVTNMSVVDGLSRALNAPQLLEFAMAGDVNGAFSAIERLVEAGTIEIRNPSLWEDLFKGPVDFDNSPFSDPDVLDYTIVELSETGKDVTLRQLMSMSPGLTESDMQSVGMFGRSQ
jgi:hypothetical protein